jgi:hypothetical protein
MNFSKRVMGMGNKKVKASLLSVNLPFNLGRIELEPDEIQQKAAWELYVELTTRIAIQPIQSDEGLMREALGSLYNIFGVTRVILRQAGPSVAQGPNSLGPVAILVLNQGLRPFLTKWHPLLLDYEQKRPQNVSVCDHEQAWPKRIEFHHDLSIVNDQMKKYAIVLGEISGTLKT